MTPEQIEAAWWITGVLVVICAVLGIAHALLMIADEYDRSMDLGAEDDWDGD